MTSNKSTNSLQDQFLHKMVENNETVSIYLVSGIRLEGIITSFDAYVIALKGQAQELVFKHAVSTIAPARGTPIGPRMPRRAANKTGAGLLRSNVTGDALKSTG